MHVKRDDLVEYGTVLALVIALAIPFLTDSMFILNLLVIMLIFIIFALAWQPPRVLRQRILRACCFLWYRGIRIRPASLRKKRDIPVHNYLSWCRRGGICRDPYRPYLCKAQGMVPCHGHVRFCHHRPDPDGQRYLLRSLGAGTVSHRAGS